MHGRAARIRYRLAALVLAVVWTSPVAVAGADSRPSIEYQVKASYLYNFLQFVDWPDVNDLPRDEYVLGVVGPERLGAALDSLEGQVVRGRRIVVRRFTDIADVTACHVLFVTLTEESDERRLLGELADRPTLTVGESSSFLDNGGVVRFVVVRNNVRFRIDPQAGRRAGLRLGAQLLQLGRN